MRTDFVMHYIWCDTCDELIYTLELHKDTPLTTASEVIDALRKAHYARHHQGERNA